jgi:hypothetical protein
VSEISTVIHLTGPCTGFHSTVSNCAPISHFITTGATHRYLMTRLSLQVVYLWRHVSSTAPPFILWWSNLELIFGPLHRNSPFIGELRYQANQMKHGPYIAERTQNAVYIVRYIGKLLSNIPQFATTGITPWQSALKFRLLTVAIRSTVIFCVQSAI